MPDVALRPTADPPETLLGRLIADVATAVYASSGYPERAGDGRSLEEQCWIAPDEGLAHLRWLRRTLPGVEPVVQYNSVAAMHVLARGGAGLDPIPCFLADPDPDLERVTPLIPELTVGLWLLAHRDLLRVARIRALLDFLHEALARQKALFAGTAKQGRLG